MEKSLPKREIIKYKNSIQAQTENGILSAECSYPEEISGIYVDFTLKHTNFNFPVVGVEHKKDDKDNKSKLNIYIWSNPASENYTDKITIPVESFTEVDLD